MVFESAHLDLQPYVGFDMARYVRRTSCSWHDTGWQSLLVQEFEHVTSVEDMALPAAADLHLVLPIAGRAVMETRSGGRATRETWLPGQVHLMLPDRASLRSYRSDGLMRTVQVHVPRGTLDAAARELGIREVDFEAVAASLAARAGGEPLIEEIIRTLGSIRDADDLYAESAAAFLSMHLLTRHAARSSVSRAPVREDRRVRTAVAMMRSRFADPLTLSEMASEAHLSVYHLVRVFKDATGVTPHRYLTGVRIGEARRLLRETELPIAQIAVRCGFASPGALSSAFLRLVGVRPSVYRNS